MTLSPLISRYSWSLIFRMSIPDGASARAGPAARVSPSAMADRRRAVTGMFDRMMRCMGCMARGCLRLVPGWQSPAKGGRHTSIATTSWAAKGGTVASSHSPACRNCGVVPATSRRTLRALRPPGMRTRTRCSPTGSSSRTGPFSIIGLVRLTRWTVSESLCLHRVTSSRPGPDTVTGGSSFVAQATALRSSLPWSTASTSQYVRSMSHGKYATRPAAGGALRMTWGMFVRGWGGESFSLGRAGGGGGRGGQGGRMRRVGRPLHAPYAVDDARRVLQPAQERMRRRGVVLEPQVGVVHRALSAAPPGRAKEVGEAKVLPEGAPFVAERGLGGGHQPAAAGYELAELVALGVGERGDVGQDERPERREVPGVQQAVVHHLERNPRLDERLVPAELRVFHAGGRAALGGVEPGGLLRVYDRDPGERALIAQVTLRAVAPRIDLLDGPEPPGVVDAAAELGE